MTTAPTNFTAPLNAIQVRMPITLMLSDTAVAWLWRKVDSHGDTSIPELIADLIDTERLREALTTRIADEAPQDRAATIAAAKAYLANAGIRPEELR